MLDVAAAHVRYLQIDVEPPRPRFPLGACDRTRRQVRANHAMAVRREPEYLGTNAARDVENTKRYVTERFGQLDVQRPPETSDRDLPVFVNEMVNLGYVVIHRKSLIAMRY